MISQYGELLVLILLLSNMNKTILISLFTISQYYFNLKALYISSCWQSRTTKKSFASPEGDHLTLVNVYRASNEFLEKRSGLSKEKREKAFRKWCKENFIDSRSLRHARDIHRLAISIPCWAMDMFQLVSHSHARFFCHPYGRSVCLLTV